MALKNYMDRPFNSISDAVKAHLASDYGCNGRLEEITDMSENATHCLSNLIQLLFDKGVITEKEVEYEVLGGLFA